MPVTAAQEEFNALSASTQHTHRSHPEDAHHSDISEPNSDSEDTRHHSSDDDSDHRTGRTYNQVMPTAVYTVPHRAFDANTGPKGVIADAQAFEKARKRTFRQTLYAFSNGLGLGENKPKTSRSSSQKSSSSEVEDDDEDEFMRTWRAKRMDEMQNQGRDMKTRRQSPSKRRYGTVASVGPIGYLDAIEKVAADTVVVVLISDEQSHVSGIIEDALSSLARKHEFTRFIKMSCEDAEMDPVTVPAILAYKAGELIANIVSVIDEIPSGRHMSSSSLETLLQQRRVLF